MYLPVAATRQSEIQAAIDQVESDLAPEGVVRIKYDIGEDWSGQWAVFFRIVLTDEAATLQAQGHRHQSCLEFSAAAGFPRYGRLPLSQLQERIGAGCPARRGVGVVLADDLLEDARHLASKGAVEKRESSMRRAISTAYYAVFHLLVGDFVEHWEFGGQRARLARMFNHQKMRDATFTPKDKKNPTQVETALIDIVTAFGQLQGDRHRADYDLGWNLVETDVNNAITLAADTFAKWRTIRSEEVARDHLLSMFGAKR
jgi:hypothetical protein